MPPLGNLTTETRMGEETIDGDLLNNEVYRRNNQEGGKSPLVEPLSKLGTQPTSKKKVYPKTDDAGLKKALKKDLNKKNLN